MLQWENKQYDVSFAVLYYGSIDNAPLQIFHGQLRPCVISKSWLVKVARWGFLVAINKDLEILLPPLHCMKMKICYYYGNNDIRVVIATKWRHYLQPIEPPYFNWLSTKFCVVSPGSIPTLLAGPTLEVLKKLRKVCRLHSDIYKSLDFLSCLYFGSHAGNGTWSREKHDRKERERLSCFHWQFFSR